MMRFSFKLRRRSPNDEVLSAYVDGLLYAPGRAEVDAQASVSPELSRRLDATRSTVDLLRSADPISAPRSFALTPAMAYGSARTMERRGPSPMVPAFAAAAAALAVGLLLVGNLTGALIQTDRAGDMLETASLMTQEGAPVSAFSSLAPQVESTEPVESAAGQSAAKMLPEDASPPLESARMLAGSESLTSTPEGAATTELAPEMLADASALQYGDEQPAPMPVGPGEPGQDGISLPLWQLQLAFGGAAIVLGLGALGLARRRRRAGL